MRYFPCYVEPIQTTSIQWCTTFQILSPEDWQAIVILLLHFFIFLLLWLSLHLFYKSFGG